MWHSLEVRFAVDHLTAAGHFPGNPIIPGAVLLDEVLQAVAGTGDVKRWVIRSAKFLQPVRPGEAIMIRWEPDPEGQTRFECRLLDPERLALTGTVQLEATAR
jgi:3-hydroxymyristoyl/3-hydroxydecanoyl-(acyl carrier protein) dehydratase